MKRFITVMMAASMCFLYAQTAVTPKDNVRIITVEDAVILAADNNITLKRQRISLEPLERKAKTAWSGIGPNPSLSGGLTKSLGELITEPVLIPQMSQQQKKKADYSYSISAGISLSLTPSLYTTIRDAQLKYESGQASYEDTVRQIELNVRKAFYSLLYTKENVNLQKRNMETARLRYENNRDKFNRGQLSELDLLTSQYNYESLRPTIESLEIGYQNSIASFKQSLGLSQDEKIELSGSLSDATPPETFTITQSVDDLPSVKKILAKIEEQKNSLMATRFSSYGPTVSARYSYSFSGDNTIKELKAHTDSQTISLNVNIPLDGYIPWSNGAQSIKNQKSTLKDLELQLENERTTAELTIQNSIKNILQKQSHIEMLDRNVELAQKSYDMTLTAYNHGSRDLYSLQNAADALLRAKTERESSIYSLISAVLDLENTLGIPFGSLGKDK